MVDIGEPTAIARALQRAQLRAHRPPDGRAGRRGALRRPLRRDRRRLVRERRGRAHRRDRARRCLLRVCLEARFHAAIDDPVFGFTLRNDVGATIFAATTDLTHGPSGHFAAGEHVVVRLDFQNWLVAQHLQRDAVDRAPRPRRRRARPARRPRDSSSCTAATCTGGVVEPAARVRAGARMSAHRARPAAPLRPLRLRRRPAPLLEPDDRRSPSPTSSCATSARCSATSGRWCGRCCSSASSTWCSRSCSASGAGVPHYPVYLLGSIVLWTFFTETTGGCVQCLLAREGLLRKMRFPRLVIPLSVGADRALQPRHELRRGARVRVRLRRQAALRPGSSCCR